MTFSPCVQAPPPEKKERQPRIWNLKPHLKPQDASAEEQRNPQLPTSVPMPTSIAEISNEHVANFLASSGSPAPPAIDPEALMAAALAMDGSGELA